MAPCEDAPCCGCGCTDPATTEPPESLSVECDCGGGYRSLTPKDVEDVKRWLF